MLCKDAEELIKNYKMGSITADNFLLLIQHTKECPKCQATFENAEASMGAGDSSEGFSSSFKIFSSNLSQKIKAMQKEKKLITRKSFYISLILILSALVITGVIKGLSFNVFFMLFATLIIVIAFVIATMLFMIE